MVRTRNFNLRNITEVHKLHIRSSTSRFASHIVFLGSLYAMSDPGVIVAGINGSSEAINSHDVQKDGTSQASADSQTASE